ncbi:MAG: hypothetical protein ACK4XK_11440, partial [Casimicrobiaceae bacterium]
QEVDPIDEAVDRINAREAGNAERIKAALENVKKFTGQKSGGKKSGEQHPIYRMSKGDTEATIESEDKD